MKLTSLFNPKLALPIDLHPELDVWNLKFSELSNYLEILETFLTPSERINASRFTRKESYEHNILSRGLLRYLLEKYLCTTASKIQLSYSTNGKPQVISNLNEHSIHFNLSHTQDLLVIAFSKKFPVGIDIESLKANIDYKEIAKAFFTTHEYAVFKTHSSASQKKLFFEIWTKKEAILKCLGQGLSYSLKTLEVLKENNLIIENRHLQILPLTLGDSHLCNLAYESNQKLTPNLHNF